MPSVSDASGLLTKGINSQHRTWLQHDDILDIQFVELLVFGSDPPFIAVSQVLSRHNPQVILMEDNETSYGLQVGAIMLTGKVISRQ